MKTVVSNRIAGCDAADTRDGFALYVNNWNTANQRLVLNWGSGDNGCLELNSGVHKVPYDVWTHVAFVFKQTSKSISPKTGTCEYLLPGTGAFFF